VRADLAQLTPERLAELTNKGLVARAQRELEAGEGPALEESAAGVVVGTFADGTRAELPARRSLAEGSCSCRAPGVCRHRVAVALAYALEHAKSLGSRETWSPGDFDDAALLEALGASELAHARASVRRAGAIELARDADGVPYARLATATVRFLGAHALAFARCDCARGGSCRHVALAVWAFRRAAGETARVELVAGERPDLAALEPALELARHVLVAGVAQSDASLSGRFARARAALERGKLTWPRLVVDELENALESYRGRSARYSNAVVRELLGELAARARAARAHGALEAAEILGSSEPAETKVGRVRLVSLGVRLERDGEARVATLPLASAREGLVLVLEKRWPDGGDGAALAQRLVAPGVALGKLARGALATKAATRLANRALALGSGHAGATIVESPGDWRELPPALVVRDLQALRAERAARPPRSLRPRILAEDVRVVALGAIGRGHYSPGEQTLRVALADEAGNPLELVRAHRAAAPHALEAIARACARGKVEAVSGELRAGARGFELDPLAIWTDAGVVVPDLEADASELEAERGGRRSSPAPHEDALAALAAVLDESVHQGLGRVGRSWLERVAAVAERLENVGLAEAGKLARALAAETRAGLEGEGAGRAAVGAWESAAVRLELLREVVAWS
jgi:hypothetical protein